jgi:hypothetical protein
MADQLLSQADIDALVLSLTRNEPVASESASAKTATADPVPLGDNGAMNKVTPVPTKAAAVITPPVTPKPVQSAASKPPAPPVNNKPAQQSVNRTTQSVVNKPTSMANNIRSVSSSQLGVAKNSTGIRQEPKTEASSEALNALNAKIASISEQLAKMDANFKRIENIEKRLTNLETKFQKNSNSPDILNRVNQLSEEYKKLVNNLKGTPGYGVRHQFTCEKCSDKGHVAQMFRCTSCGHERWYGWWPSK